MLISASPNCCYTHPRALALSWWRAAARVAVVCLAVVCCWEDGGEAGEQRPGNRFYAPQVPWIGADAGGPNALPEMPALPAAADRRNPWLARAPLAPLDNAPQSFLLTARPIPRAPPPPIATPAPNTDP